MCLTVAIEQGPNLGLLATDTRRSQLTGDGELLTSDPGGKLRRVPHGFVAATGDATVGYAGLDRLEAVDARDRDAMRQAVSATYREVGPEVKARYEEADPANTYFFVLARDRVRPEAYRVKATGELLEDPSTSVLVGWPFEDDAEGNRQRRKRTDDFLEAIVTPGSVDDFVRRVAALFASVAAVETRVSGELDLAMVLPDGLALPVDGRPDPSGFYRVFGDAAEIATGRRALDDVISSTNTLEVTT